MFKVIDNGTFISDCKQRIDKSEINELRRHTRSVRSGYSFPSLEPNVALFKNALIEHFKKEEAKAERTLNREKQQLEEAINSTHKEEQND